MFYLTAEQKNRIDYLTAFLNKCCDEYYNKNNPSLSDAEYDALFDELTSLENETGYRLDNSPTLRAGYEVASELKKVSHNIPLLSLAKTKDPSDVLKMAQVSEGYLGLKMDGLTVKLTYENGVLLEAATRGDGAVGEVITHTAKTFVNVPKSISYLEHLEVSGEAFIDIATFEKINEGIDNDEDKYSTPRNLASGSVRQLDSSVTAARGVKFLPFNVLVGFEDIPSRTQRLDRLQALGFDRLPYELAGSGDTLESITEKLYALKDKAAELNFPIDGVVFSYDDTEFSSSLGRTSHHFKDGIAFKFGDPSADTVLKDIEWNISRSGQLTPVAVFEPCNIDNTTVERASLHNLTFIEELKLLPKDSIRVSKRNMIIPHIEENYSSVKRSAFTLDFPHNCPICKGSTVINESENGGRIIRVLYCSNPRCAGKRVKEFTHFVSKPAMNIEGLSEQTLLRFISAGFLSELADIFRLPEHKDEIITMEGFGEKSFENLCASLEKAKNPSLSNFLVALNIPLIGSAAARDMETVFNGDMGKLLSAVKEGYDFSSIENFGQVTNEGLHLWFENDENLTTVNSLLPYLTFKEVAKTSFSGEFANKTCVITGTFESFGRDELSSLLREKGAKVTSSVSKNTDMVLCGEKAGSKLDKAKALGVRVVLEDELLSLLNM